MMFPIPPPQKKSFYYTIDTNIYETKLYKKSLCNIGQILLRMH